MSLTLEDLDTGTDHERVVFCRDPQAGYRGVIAVHSTAAGPAVGGTRLWSYGSEAEAVADALRLSRGMTFKNAVAGLPVGGGKSVILAAEGMDREAVLLAHGRAIEALGGAYIAGEDVGTSPADMTVMQRETRHVAGIVHDPSPNTARGVTRAIQAAALHRWGSSDLAGRTVAIQGCGNVGFHLALELRQLGARLLAADVDPGRVRRTVEATGAQAIGPDEVVGADADVLAPCALGGVLNEEAIPHLRAAVVAGAANNQLREDEDGERLRNWGVLYAPDYVVNAGGVIGGCREILGWSEADVRGRIEGIYDTLLAVLRRADAEGVPPSVAADRLAGERLESLRRARGEVSG